jgi:hypothetical protein
VTRLLTTSAILLALASPALAAYTKDMGCVLKDNQGNTLTYIFVIKDDNDQDASGTAHGVMYELAFSKNGDMPQADSEPLWDVTAQQNGAILIPQSNPDWTMSITRAGVDLLHGETVVAHGACRDMNGEADALQKEREKNQRDRFVYGGLNLIKSLAGIAGAIHGH